MPLIRLQRRNRGEMALPIWALHIMRPFAALPMRKKMKINPLDYDQCSTNIPHSILKYFGAEEGRKTNPNANDRFCGNARLNLWLLLLSSGSFSP